MSTAGAGSGLLGAVVASFFLGYALSRIRLRRVEIALGEEMGRFLAYATGILLVWSAMGLVALIPLAGPYLGWDWVPSFLSRVTPSEPLSTLAGLLVSGCCISGLTLAFYTQGYNRVFLRMRNFGFPFTPAGRWTMALASFYLATLMLDVLRVVFTTETTGTLTWSAVGTAVIYASVIAGAPLLERGLQRRGLNAFRGFSVVQLVAVVVMSSLIGDELRAGSVHLGPLVYATFFRGFTGNLPGCLTLLAGVVIVGMVVRRRWPSRLRHTPAVAPIRQAHNAPAPPPGSVPSAAPRWRRFDKATGKRVDWP